ncbi:MAG TPA: tetratricopeptide repeat protein [Planctomycetota bacterium]|nr:tetratricopeptide repeat protein [Planctomycetota bacterium]
MIRGAAIAGVVALALFGSGCAGKEAAPVEGARTLVDKGRLAALGGDHRMAVDLYTQAVAEDPEFAEAYNERGKSNVQLRLAPGEGRDVRIYEQNALVDFTIAVQKNPSYADAYFNRAMVLASRAQYKLAVDDLLSAIRYNPQNPDAHRWLGNIYELKFEDRLLPAMEHYEKYVDLGGTDPDIREKVRQWKEYRKAASATPVPVFKPTTAEDERKAAEMHARAMELLALPDKTEGVQMLESLLATYGNTKYVQTRVSALQAVILTFKKRGAPK